MTGEEYANLLSNIQKINKIEWVTKGDPWEADVCKIRVFADSITFDMIWGYPKYSAELTKEINNCIKLLEDNGVSVNFNAEE